MKVGIVVASYGTPQWQKLGDEHAMPTAETQQADQVVRVHEPNGDVASSRNLGASRIKTDLIVFLDSDDQLAPGYVSAIRDAATLANSGWPLLFTPAISYIRHGRPQEPKFWPECDLSSGNWLIIGTAVPRKLWKQVGGFDSNPAWGAFEDYEFWIRCVKAGAKIIKVPNAVYVATVNDRSRHRSAPHMARQRWHYEIGREHYPDQYPPEWLPQRMRTRTIRRGIQR